MWEPWLKLCNSTSHFACRVVVEIMDLPPPNHTECFCHLCRTLTAMDEIRSRLVAKWGLRREGKS